MKTSSPTSPLRRLALLTAVVASLAACSALESDKLDYKSAGKAPTLEVPPDLTQLSRENRYAVPGGAVTATAYQAGIANAPGIPTAVGAMGDVRMERAGAQRWIVVGRSADQLWELVRDFWQESGFLLTLDQRNLGIMETDWAENRAKLPNDIVRRTVGKVGLHHAGFLAFAVDGEAALFPEVVQQRPELLGRARRGQPAGVADALNPCVAQRIGGDQRHRR